jgi:hypothetical protein
MASMTFNLVQQLVDRLSPAEQMQLLAYIAPKLAGALAEESGSGAADASGARPATWEEFFAAGDALSEGSRSGESMTAAVLAMRR